MRASLAFAALLILLAANVRAHGGEDHGAPAPTPTQVVAPRAVAVSDDFEAVAVLDGGKLLLYLDRFASNEPVAGAKVEIEGGTLKGIAKEVAPGVYALDAAPPAPGKYPLTITVEAGDSADLLSATLELATADAQAAPPAAWHNAVAWAMAVLLAAGAAFRLWRKRARKELA